MVGFAHGAPIAAFFEKRYHMIGIAFGCFEIKQERFCTVIPQCGGSQHSALYAVRLVGTDDCKRRRACVAGFFEVDRKLIEEVLDFDRRIKFFENGEIFSQVRRECAHGLSIAEIRQGVIIIDTMFKNRRIFSRLIVIGILVIASAQSVFAAPVAKKAAKPKPHQYVRIFYYSGGKAAKKSFLSHPKSIDVFAPQSYTLDANGALSGSVDDTLLVFARKNKIEVMPLITNKRFNESAAHTLLDDPLKQDSAISALIAEARDRQYWGWQFDFEQMDVSYRDKYSAFIKKAGDEMHKNGLAVSVAVVAQVSQNPEDYPKDIWQRVIGVYDYAALASRTDFISVMSYDDPESKGPIARYAWVKRVIEYSLQSVPKEKLSLGIPLYMWRWDTGREKLVGIGGYKNIKTVLATRRVTYGYSAIEQAPFITYSFKKKNYIIWYENAKSVAKKLELIASYKLHGFSAWALGLEMLDIHRVVKKP